MSTPPSLSILPNDRSESVTIDIFAEEPVIQRKSGRIFVLIEKTAFLGSAFKSLLIDLVQRIRALGLDIIAVIVLIPTSLISVKKFWDPKNVSHRNVDPDKPVVLMIHGFLGRSNHWIYHRQKLVNNNIKNVFTVDLGSPFHTVEEYAAVVDERLKEMRKILPNNQKVILVCHSMGGLVADAYKKLYAEASNTEILDTITIGTPLSGTPVAYVAAPFSRAARQMLPSSDFSQHRTMKASRRYEDNKGNTVSELITINRQGLKTIEKTKKINNQGKNLGGRPGKPVSVIKTNIKEEKVEDNPFKKRVITQKTFSLSTGVMVLKETSKEVVITPQKALHIGSTYDTVVPCASAIDLTSDNRDNVLGKHEIKGMGGHGWQLFSPEIHQRILKRINETVEGQVTRV
jgi:hypothetical protein